MATITVTLGGQILLEVPLVKERITIGRRPHNDVVLDMRAVSAEHAAILTIQQDSFLEDLNSTNGLQVNGQPVSRHYLQDQDVIQLAKYEIRYTNDAQGHQGDLTTKMVSAFEDTETIEEDPLPPNRGQTAIVGIVDGVPQPMPFLKVLTGPSAGKEMVLSKSLTTIGRPGVQIAVVTRRPQGFLITHVEGDAYPLVNGVSIGSSAHPLASGNVVNLSGTEVEFVLR